ncbi:phospholipase effector Tle1 domain-containing protein [Sphingomonas sp. CFBP 13706]|uniref:phospholipase effector Tle1 domain-containing protein n=1 Tax=Sphingomonas sp. CFBP 13706 TaxID=2775314 RepID=UPI0017867741|nr:DUF2235 domain-containing protein [Sphingomonas sp. CFBP 13706]MBD8736687.1 DUF2235 domain-containing protein [Sphingomonas sp. CFBP 13706]
MPKTIMIFSDGTGQLGGLSPDQRLSNVYKMYRAMRPGPDSPIPPSRQVAFYDAGLGVGEVGGLTFRRVRNLLAAAVGTGIDENVIDCYAAIVARYEPGDRVCLVGFSRGAYTVRALANVMNLCGVPTRCADGGPVPLHGPPLRAIASEAVRKVYNHGAGSKREAFETERESLASRFRAKHGSEGVGVEGDLQGNVQPSFVGVFDTVAALGSRSALVMALVGMTFLLAVTIGLWHAGLHLAAAVFAILPAMAAYWVARSLFSQVKTYLDDHHLAMSPWDPRRWLFAIRHSHGAWWSGENYDRFVDKEIPCLRHALSIDEDRARFPRVGWGSAADVAWNKARGRGDWLDQVWFAGNHSDIGGSYPEDESRLSDIALRWMVEQLRRSLGDDVVVLDDRLVTSPDPLGLQHSERIGSLYGQPSWLRRLTGDQLTWGEGVREVDAKATLHPSVFERLAAPSVPQMDKVAPYRPKSLSDHLLAKRVVAGERIEGPNSGPESPGNPTADV